MQDSQKSHFQMKLTSEPKVSTWVRIDTVNPANSDAIMPKL
jgi:hypothetical protein